MNEHHPTRVSVRVWQMLVALTSCAMGLALAWVGLASTSAAQAAAPISVPGIIEAEDFAAGEEGVAYSDTDESVGEYRTDEVVDAYVRAGFGASGDKLLGRTRDGEFTTYEIDAGSGGEFDVRLRVASGADAPGVIHVDIDGERVGTVDGDTDRWFDWTMRSAGTVNLDAGAHTVKLTWDEGANVNLDLVKFVATTPGPASCDAGYQSVDDATLAGRFAPVANGDPSAVAVPRGDGGRWFAPNNDYVEFCVSVDEPGTYGLMARVRAVSSTKRSFFVSVDDGPMVDFVYSRTLTDAATIPVTDAPGDDPLPPTKGVRPAIEDLTFDLKRGDHIVRFYVRRDGAELSGMQFVAIDQCGNCAAVGQFLSELLVDPPPERDSSLCATFFATCTDDLTRVTSVNIGLDPDLQPSVPASIGALDGIEELTMCCDALAGNTNWVTLPAEIGNLTDLKRLRIQLHGVNTLPAEIGNLSSLERLDLAAGNLLSLPPEIGDLSVLDTLWLMDNLISTLPPEIGQLDNLRTLRLDDNRVSSLPPEIGDLDNLGGLLLFNNRLTSLPAEIGDLANLDALLIHGNQLTTLPAELGNLSNLTILTAYDNNLSGDITWAEPLVDRAVPASLTFADGPGVGNECLTTTSQLLADHLDETDPGWDDCGADG